MGSLIVGSWKPVSQRINGETVISRMSRDILAKACAGETCSYRPGTSIKDCPESPELVVIPSGSFIMGSGPQEQGIAVAWGANFTLTKSETPQHLVSISSFAAGQYAVTRGEFAAFVKATGYETEAESRYKYFPQENVNNYNWRYGGFSQDDQHPVVYVSRADIGQYIQWISQISGKRYRLLTEAEWEYAARGGTDAAFWWGDGISTAQANYEGDFGYPGSPFGQIRKATVPVDFFNANPFGLYNVHGNVWELVEDSWAYNYLYAPQDGSARPQREGYASVLRGGSWRSRPAELRSASRLSLGGLGGLWCGYQDEIGFRLARDLV